MEKIKVSIIIPVYNVEEYIKSCLTSVIGQTYEGSIECLLVDDCGQDSSMDIVNNVLRDYNGSIDFRILHHDKNRGLSAARNTGINAATGDYIYFLDSDDEITHDCIENIVHPLSKTPNIDFIIGDYRIEGEQRNLPSLDIDSRTILYNKDILDTFIMGKWYMMAWNKLCNRAFLINNCLYFKEGIIHEDDLWSFQLASLAKTMGIIYKVGYIYKIRENSITGNNQIDKSIRSRIEVLCSILKFIRLQNIELTMTLNHFIQSQIYLLLNTIYRRFGKKDFKYVYYRLRSYNLLTPYYIIKYNKFSPKKLIRDLHLLFPKNIGMICELFFISIMTRFKTQTNS